jgi:hypothetical protein
MPAAEFQRWVATSGKPSYALQLGREFLANPRHVFADPPPAFVIVSFHDASRSDLLATVTKAFSHSRICLAVDVATLKTLDAETLDRRRVGLLLDNVSAQTSLDCIASQAVEAARFSPGFVLDAATHLRSACILAAMLGLVRELGACTLGPEITDTGNSLPPELGFDYVPGRSTWQGDRPATPKLAAASRLAYPGRALT